MPAKRPRRHGGAAAEPELQGRCGRGQESRDEGASLAMPLKRPRRHGGAAAEPELQGRCGRDRSHAMRVRRWPIALGVLLLGRKKRQPRFADRGRIVPPDDPDPRAEWLVLLLLLGAAAAAVGFIVVYSFNHLAHQTQYLGLALGLAS